MKKELITKVDFDEINHWDYPEYCDAYIVYAKYDGVEMTEAQLEEVNQDDMYVREQLEIYLS